MKYTYYLLLCICCMGTVASAQQLMQSSRTVPLKELQRREDSMGAIRMLQQTTAAKTTAAVFDTSMLISRINSCWGPGLTATEKLSIFDAYWGQVDSFYGSFTGLPMYNWDSIVNAMRTEISAGVSKGRFAGIIGELSRYINDGHSYFQDYDLYSTATLFGAGHFFMAATDRYMAHVLLCWTTR